MCYCCLTVFYVGLRCMLFYILVLWIECVVVKGFDEYMNLVLDEAEEVHMKTKNRKTLG